jgi:hypothetical protein
VISAAKKTEQLRGLASAAALSEKTDFEDEHGILELEDAGSPRNSLPSMWCESGAVRGLCQAASSLGLPAAGGA